MMHPQEIANCLNAVQMMLNTLKGDKYAKQRFNLLSLKSDLKEDLSRYQRPVQPQPQES